MKTAFAVLLFILCSTFGFAQTSIYSTNFDNETAGQAVPGWFDNGTCLWATSSWNAISSPSSFGPTTSAAGSVCGTGLYEVPPMLSSSQMLYDTTVQLDSSGAGFFVSPVFRSDSLGKNSVLLLLEFQATSGTSTALNVSPFKSTNGVYMSTGSNVVVSGAWTNGERVYIRTQVQGLNWSFKIWQYGSSEPGTWSATGTFPSGTSTLGYDGFYASDTTVGPGANGTYATVDDFTLYEMGIVSAPSFIFQNTTGNVLSLTGAGTSWVSGTTTFSVSGVTGVTITSQTVTSPTTATVTLSTGAATGTLAIAENSDASVAYINIDATPVVLPVTSANWYFSPYNTQSNGSGALQANNTLPSSTETIWNNPGAYFKAEVTSTSNITVLVNTSSWSGCASVACPSVKYSVDGGTWQTYTITGSETSIPILVNGPLTTHSLWFYYINSPEGNRWTGNPPAGSLIVTGLQVDGAPGSLSPLTGIVALKPANCLFLGDSIMEGRFTESGVSVGTTYPAAGDAQHVYLSDLSETLNCEYGNVSFSGQGWTVAGSSGSPAFPSSWNFYSSGVSRLYSGKLSPMPNFVMANEGTNDGSTNIQSTVISTLASIRSAVNTATPIVLMTPFNGNQASNLAYAALGSGDPYVYNLNLGTEATYGIISQAFGSSLFSFDGLHPNAYNHGRLATMLEQAIQKLFPVNGQRSITTLQ